MFADEQRQLATASSDSGNSAHHHLQQTHTYMHFCIQSTLTAVNMITFVKKNR